MPTALITGGTSGIGQGLTVDLARHGYAVHFVGRDRDRGERLQASLRAEGHHATFHAVDLAVLRDVQRFADTFATAVPSLDRLVCSAGVILPREQRTSEGHEVTLAVLCFGVQLLCTALAPALARAHQARIVTISGRPALVLRPRLDLTNLDSERRYRGLRTAAAGVHAKTVLTQCLAERLAPQGILVNAVHPGPVRSDLGRSLPWPLRRPVQWVTGWWPEVSASAVHVCRSPLGGVTGQLFVGTEPRPLAFDAGYREALWQRVDELVSATLAGDAGPDPSEVG